MCDKLFRCYHCPPSFLMELILKYVKEEGEVVALSLSFRFVKNISRRDEFL